MNYDNRRLQEIQRERIVYEDLLDKAETISDVVHYQEKLCELQDEEKDILSRFDVVV